MVTRQVHIDMNRSYFRVTRQVQMNRFLLLSHQKGSRWTDSYSRTTRQWPNEQIPHWLHRWTRTLVHKSNDQQRAHVHMAIVEKSQVCIRMCTSARGQHHSRLQHQSHAAGLYRLPVHHFSRSGGRNYWYCIAASSFCSSTCCYDSLHAWELIA